jgi:hypothetical protein
MPHKINVLTGGESSVQFCTVVNKAIKDIAIAMYRAALSGEMVRLPIGLTFEFYAVARCNPASNIAEWINRSVNV